MKYDIFISYRRDGGEYTAKILKDRLEDLGYRVFFDVESLRSGSFNTKLYSVIEECKDFILVLSPNSLDRCVNPEDWVRAEIVQALKCNKNIVPVMLRGFVFPQELPEEIDAVRYKNGLESNSEFFDAFIERLRIFLFTKPNIKSRLTQNTVFKRTLPFFLALLVLASLAIGGVAIYNKYNSEYPRSKAEVNLTGEVFLYTQNNLMAANTISMAMGNVYEACDQYLTNQDELSYQAALSAIEEATVQLGKVDMEGQQVSNTLSEALNKSAFDKADILGLNEYVAYIYDDYIANMATVKFYINPYSLLDLTVRQQLIAISAENLELFSEYMVYYTNAVLFPVSADYEGLADYKKEVLSYYTSLPFKGYTWVYEETELQTLMTMNANQYSDNVNEVGSIVGDINVALMQEKAELVTMLIEIGLTQEEAEEYVAAVINTDGDLTEVREKCEAIIQGREELAASEENLTATNEEAKKKFAPLDTDDIGTLWGKMLRFLSLSMPDEAKKCVQMYQLKAKATDAFAETYVPIVIQFIDQMADTGIDYGVIITSFASGEPTRGIYQVGDIVIAINGTMCLNYDDFDELYKSGEENTMTILRLGEDNKFTTEDYVDDGTQELQAYLNSMTEAE